MKRIAVQSIYGIMLLVFTTTFVFAEGEFPGRKLYLNTPFIEMEELHATFDSSLMIDVRSPYEFQTLHISGAVNISIKSRDFISRISELRKQYKDKTLVTYCNGKTCMKSYKAAVKCRNKGINNVKVFDAGVLDWATTYPRQAVLLGKSPINPSHIISKKTFKSHLLQHEEFIKQASSKSSFVIDIRDPAQRAGMSLFMGIEKRFPLDKQEQMRPHIEKAIKENKTIYVYDEAGKQVRWLMYFLRDIGATNFYFMDGGMKSFYASLRKDF